MSESTPKVSHAPPPRASGLPFVLRILGGCVVVAVIVGIGLFAEQVTADDDLRLPDEVAGLPMDDSAEARDRYAYHDDQVSDAFDGADAVSGVYGGTEDEPLLVTAVEAESGPPLPTWFDDPETLRVSAPLNEIVDEGDVTCLVTRPAEAAEEGAEEPAPVAVLCQRTSGDLMVRVLGTRGTDLDDVVDATNEIWEELS